MKMAKGKHKVNSIMSCAAVSGNIYIKVFFIYDRDFQP